MNKTWVVQNNNIVKFLSVTDKSACKIWKKNNNMYDVHVTLSLQYYEQS